MPRCKHAIIVKLFSDILNTLDHLLSCLSSGAPQSLSLSPISQTNQDQSLHTFSHAFHSNNRDLTSQRRNQEVIFDRFCSLATINTVPMLCVCLYLYLFNEMWVTSQHPQRKTRWKVACCPYHHCTIQVGTHTDTHMHTCTPCKHHMDYGAVQTNLCICFMLSW